MRNYIRIAFTMSLLAGFAGSAVAGDDKAKAPTPAAKAPTPAAKPAPAPPAGDKAQAPMQMPTAPAEVAAAVKAMAGTWRCQGSTFMPDGTATPIKATMKTKIALDKFWAQVSFVETGKKNGYKFESYRTFDGKKWHGLMVDNMGGSEVSTSDGPKENKVIWEGSGRSAMGEAKARHHEELLSAREVKMWGEWSMDKGKTWVKGYDATCKK